MRKHFIDFICDIAKEDPSVCLLTADLGYSVIEPFSEQFPERFFNVGVAEQNMVGIAAGLASEGFKPYTYSIGIFPTFRCAEQLRNDIDYHNLPVVTCTVGAGVAYGALGYTHHAVQDLALMRTMPNTIIATPSDPVEVLSILSWQRKYPCPMYLRMHKAGNKKLHSKILNIEPGEWINIHNPKNKESKYENCILSIGSITPKIIEIASEINPNIPIYTLPMWGQKFKEKQIKMLDKFDNILVVEDHLIDGGFCSWLMECSSDCTFPPKIIPISIESSTVGKVAKESTLLESLFINFKNNLLSLSNKS